MRGLSQEQAQVLAFMQGRVPHTRRTPSDHESMADHGVAENLDRYPEIYRL